VSFRGLAHLDSKIGLDDPTLGFTHNHNIAAALDLGFLNDRIAFHMGANVPIYPSTFDATRSVPVGTLGMRVKPTDAFTIGADASLNLRTGDLLNAGVDLTYRPERLFGIDTDRRVFIRGSYDYHRADPMLGRPDEHVGMVGVGINFGGGSGRSRPRSSVSEDYENPVTSHIERPDVRTPRPADGTTTYTSSTNSAGLISGVKAQIDQLQNEAVAAHNAGDTATARRKTAEAMALLNSPEMISAAIGRGGGFFNYQFHLDEPSKFTPTDFFAKGYGVCAEYHTFAAAALRRNGYRAYPVEFFAPGLSHVVTLYQDRSGQWQIMEYGEIHKVNAASPEAAIKAFQPGVMKYKLFEPEGGRSRVVHEGTSSMTTSLRSFFDRSWIP
jgi:hypothetical protein